MKFSYLAHFIPTEVEESRPKKWEYFLLKIGHFCQTVLKFNIK